MTKKAKFAKQKFDLSYFDNQTTTEWYGLASTSMIPLDHIPALVGMLNVEVQVFIDTNIKRLIREFQDGLDRGCHFRIHPNFYLTANRLCGENPWSSNDYPEYMDRGKTVERPKDAKYAKGDVVVVDTEGDKGLAVVLGCIDHEGGDLRLDLCGMTSMDHIRHATEADIRNADTHCGMQIQAHLGFAPKQN